MTSARKIKLRLTTPKPRNPLTAPALLRKAGTHRASTRSERQAARRQLHRGLKDED